MVDENFVKELVNGDEKLKPVEREEYLGYWSVIKICAIELLLYEDVKFAGNIFIARRMKTVIDFEASCLPSKDCVNLCELAIKTDNLKTALNSTYETLNPDKGKP